MNPLLSMASALYRMGQTIDRKSRGRNPTRLPKPVISVGNLTMGGTGKTPLLLRLLKDLRLWGYSPAVLTRGYRGFGSSASRSAIVMGKAASLRAGVNDETVLAARQFPDLPIAIGADRAAAAKKLLEAHSPDLFVLDDGFQHWPLSRDLDIVCIDLSDPWGGGHLFPRGRLREPPGALKRAGLVVLTRGELSTQESRATVTHRLKELPCSAQIVTSRFVPSLHNARSGDQVNLAEMSGQRAVALSAIGNPGSFETCLKLWGVDVTPLRFRDHHHYREKDVKKAQSLAKARGAVIVTTEKDLVKMEEFIAAASVPILIVKIQTAFLDDGETIWEHVVQKAAGPRH